MKRQETSYNYKNKISLAVLLIIVAWFIFSVVKKGNINKNLYQNGEITNAIITNTKKVGGKGIKRCTYSFSLNGTKYDGWADNDYYKVGDTIKILYLKVNPEINRDKKFIDKIYE
jgi:hypothetical protein